MNKSAFIRHCQQFLTEKHQSIKNEFLALKESLESESKSTAGDKHETGRAMIHIEMEQLAQRTEEVERQINILNRLNALEKRNQISDGCLVQVGKNWFFTGCPIGKISFNQQMVFCLSSASPLGKELYGRKKGESIIFNSKQETIEEIL